MASGSQWNRPGCPFVPEPIFLNKWEQRLCAEQPPAAPFLPASTGGANFPVSNCRSGHALESVPASRRMAAVYAHPDHPMWGTQRGDSGFQNVEQFPTALAPEAGGADGTPALAETATHAYARYQEEPLAGRFSCQKAREVGVETSQGQDIDMFPPHERAECFPPRPSYCQHEACAGCPERCRRSVSHVHEEMVGASVPLAQKENAPWGMGLLSTEPLSFDSVSAPSIVPSQQETGGRKESRVPGRSSRGSTPPPSNIPPGLARAPSFSVPPFRESPPTLSSTARASVSASTDFPTPSTPRQVDRDPRLATPFPENPVPIRGRLYSRSCETSEADSFRPSKSPRCSSGRVSVRLPSPGTVDWVSSSHVTSHLSKQSSEASERVTTPRRAGMSNDSHEARLLTARPSSFTGGAPAVASSNPRGSRAPDASAASSSFLRTRSSLCGRGPREGFTALSAALSVFPFLLPTAAVLPLDPVGRKLERTRSRESTEHMGSPSAVSSQNFAGIPLRRGGASCAALDVFTPGSRQSVSTPPSSPPCEMDSASHADSRGLTERRKSILQDQQVQETLLALLVAATPAAEEADLRRLQRNSLELDLLLPGVSVTDAGLVGGSSLGSGAAGDSQRDLHGRSAACSESNRRRVSSGRLCSCLSPLVSSLHTQALCDLYEEEAFFLPEQDILEVKFNWWQMLKREFRLQMHWEMQQEFQSPCRRELPRPRRQERLLSRWSYCVSSVSARHVPVARRLLQEGPRTLLADTTGDSTDHTGLQSTDPRHPASSSGGRDGLGAIDVGALLSGEPARGEKEEEVMDCSEGGEGRRALSRSLRQHVWTWMWECAANLGFCVSTRFLGLQLLDAYLAHEQSPVDPENETQVSLVAVASLLVAAGLRGHWKDLEKDAYLAGIVRGLDFPYSLDDVIQTQHDILQLLPAGLMLSKTVVDYFRLFLAHLRDLFNVVQHLDALPECPVLETGEGSGASSLRQSSRDTLGLASRSDTGSAYIRVSAGSGGELQCEERRFPDDLQQPSRVPSPFLFEQSGQDGVKSSTSGRLLRSSSRRSRWEGGSGVCAAELSRDTAASAGACRDRGASFQQEEFFLGVSESDEARGGSGDFVSLFGFWKSTGLLACLEALILRSCSALAGSVGPSLLVPPSRLVAALLLRLMEPYSTVRMAEGHEKHNSLLTDKSEQEPVLGHPGIVSWSRFICSFVFRLHYDADMVFWKAVLAPLVDGVLHMEDNHCFLALWKAGTELWAQLISQSCRLWEADQNSQSSASLPLSSSTPFPPEKKLSSDKLPSEVVLPSERVPLVMASRVSSGSVSFSHRRSRSIGDSEVSREPRASASRTQGPRKPEAERSASAETPASWRRTGSPPRGSDRSTESRNFLFAETGGPFPGEAPPMVDRRASLPGRCPAGSDRRQRAEAETGGRPPGTPGRLGSCVSTSQRCLTPPRDGGLQPSVQIAASSVQDFQTWRETGELAFEETMQWEAEEDGRFPPQRVARKTLPFLR
ncbi:amine-terminal domain cyclin [Toxoplasma gondii RUB]|uniref:Amine-terminal domain cyclin n=1 Tax=Toxoplasma gondii RUB TaxID=935652 RepID=A0A086M5Q7_TOXGO|nr:amine-terminal domain cyclin [Toxoplasma gondii RUB]